MGLVLEQQQQSLGSYLRRVDLERRACRHYLSSVPLRSPEVGSDSLSRSAQKGCGLPDIIVGCKDRYLVGSGSNCQMAYAFESDDSTLNESWLVENSLFVTSLKMRLGCVSRCGGGLPN